MDQGQLWCQRGTAPHITVESYTLCTSSGEVILFSTASTTPSLVCTPTAVEPSCKFTQHSAAYPC